MSASRARLIRFLADSGSYPGRPRTVRMIQTHSSWIALTPRNVYKVKKAVNLGFLDFSSLGKRRHYCEREVELNRRLSPGVYLGVRAIHLHQGRLSFEAAGKAVEYAVEMRRLSAGGFMLRRLRRGEVSGAELDLIVKSLVSVYQHQSILPQISVWGRVARLRISTDENFRQMKDAVGRTITRAAFEAIREFTNLYYRRHARRLNARVEGGHILDCHGDLHLEHIHLERNGVSIFDCIEFNDRFRYIDVANDAAFLAMDFDFRGRPDLGSWFARKLSAALDDPELLRILGFYKCYRACVRGKVESLQAVNRGVVAAERQGCAERAQRYFRLALQYAAFGTKPTSLVVMGGVATGKTTLAGALARELGWEIFSSDSLRKEIAGVSLHRRGSAAERRALYSAAMTKRTYAELCQRASAALEQGRSVVLDATFSKRQHRDDVRRLLCREGARVFFVETWAPPNLIRKRLASRAAAGGEISDARLEDLPMIERRFTPPAELAASEHLRVRTGTSTESEVSFTLRALVRSHLAADTL